MFNVPCRGHIMMRLSLGQPQFGSIMNHSHVLVLPKNVTLQIKCVKKYFFFAVKPVESQRGLSMVNTALLQPDVVLSEKNRKSCISRLKQYKTNRKELDDVKKAAVLVPLCMHKGELGLLYTLRSTKLNSNRGQVSFPGGMHDKKDSSLEETALRETWEELKIPKDKVDVWTCGNLIGKKTMNVMPVLGYIGEVDADKLEINPDEVEEAFVMSLRSLCDLSLCRFTQFRDSYTLPTYLGGKYRIWGFTAAITHMVLNSLLPNVYTHKLVFLPSIDSKTKHAQHNKPF